MQLMFAILVEQSENYAKWFDILRWTVLLWLTVIVIEMKMIAKVFELKEGLTWVRKMEEAIWSMINVTSMIMMMIVMIVVIIRPAMVQ